MLDVAKDLATPLIENKADKRIDEIHEALGEVVKFIANNQPKKDK
jgi:hypothetical protein